MLKFHKNTLSFKKSKSDSFHLVTSQEKVKETKKIDVLQTSIFQLMTLLSIPTVTTLIKK